MMSKAEKCRSGLVAARAGWWTASTASGLGHSRSHRRRFHKPVSHPWRSRRPQTTHGPSIYTAAGEPGHLKVFSALVDGAPRFRRWYKEGFRYPGEVTIRPSNRHYLLYTQFLHRRPAHRCCAAPSDAEPPPPEGDTGREQRGEVIAFEPFAEMAVWRRWPAACRRRCRPPRPLLALPAAIYLPGTVRADRGGRRVVMGAGRGCANTGAYMPQSNNDNDARWHGGRGGVRRREAGRTGGGRALACPR